MIAAPALRRALAERLAATAGRWPKAWFGDANEGLIRVYRGGSLNGSFWTGERETAERYAAMADEDKVLREAYLDARDFPVASMSDDALAAYRRSGAAQSVDPFVLEQLARVERDRLPGIILENVPDTPTFRPQRQYIVRDQGRFRSLREVLREMRDA